MIGRRPVVTLILFALGALLASGCGGDNGSGETGSTRATRTEITEGSPRDLFGRWTGVLHQQNLAPFTVRVTIRSLEEPSMNVVHYSGIDCGGNWTYEGRPGRGYLFHEVIDRGAGGNCKGVGEVTVTPSSGELDYIFRGEGVKSSGVLHRAGTTAK